MENLFSFLFKYRPFFFQNGEFTFQWPLPFWQISLAVLAFAGLTALLYRRQVFRPTGRRGWRLVVLRSLVFLIFALLLMRPSLMLSRMVEKENLLATLVDNSRSMGLSQGMEPARGKPVVELLDEESPFSKDLEERFYLRHFVFDSGARRVEQPIPADWAGTQTNIVAGLERVLAETKNLPLAGIVLFSDGSDNSYRSFDAVLGDLKARRIPVHVVGLGPESFDQDVELAEVSAPRSAIPESVSVARLTFRHHGYGGSQGRLEVRDGNALIQTQEIHFPRDAETFTTEVKFIPKSAGVKVYDFRLQPLEGEQIVENNRRSTVIQVRDLAARVLYVEGHPRWEYKFIRRALQDDKHIRLETLLRTAINKFYRQGIEEETTLATGFPSERDVLFNYDGIILGNVESSFFTYQQMEMVRDFAGKRGGGFLMLGGSSSFASGQYQNTPIEEILPVWLEENDRVATSSMNLYAQGESKIDLTDHGKQHPVLQLSLDSAQNLTIWQQTPELRDWNIVRDTKPGATVLARLRPVSDATTNEDFPLLVFQRYGRGHTLAFLTSSSWRWQMLQDHEDQTHQTFWRQIMRWLVSSAKRPITVETQRDVYAQNEVVKIRAEVSDTAFNRINDARVVATITPASGEPVTVPLQWTVQEDGIYSGEYTAQPDGLHRVRIEVDAGTLPKDQARQASTFFLTSSGSQEFFQAVQKREFLQKLAEQTGGNYYSISSARRLPEEIVYNRSQASFVEVLDLWDMPFNFLLLVGLLFAEWVVRKKMGYI